jgi:hypothetical protein
MKTASALGFVALTELAAHFLSLGWGLMVLLAAFAWVAMSGASVAAKARSTEDRVNNLIPVVGAAATAAANAYPKTGGTISGNVTVTGSHTVNGQINSNTLSVSGNATTSGNHTVHGSLISDNNVSAGGQVSGGSFSGGSIHVSGNAQADGSFSAGSVSTGHYDGSSIHVSGNAQADGSLSAGNFSGSYHGGQGGVSSVGGAPSTYSSSYETSLASAINGLINRLNSAGLI